MPRRSRSRGPEHRWWSTISWRTTRWRTLSRGSAISVPKRSSCPAASPSVRRPMRCSPRRRQVRWSRHRRQQCGHHAGSDAAQHVRRRMGFGGRRAPARSLPALPQCGGLLARQVEAGGRPGLRAAGQHVLGGRSARAARAAQLRRRQGRHHRTHPFGRPRSRAVRGPGERDLPPRAHVDDRGGLRRRTGRRYRSALARPCGESGRLSRLPGRRSRQRQVFIVYGPMVA